MRSGGCGWQKRDSRRIHSDANPSSSISKQRCSVSGSCIVGSCDEVSYSTRHEVSAHDGLKDKTIPQSRALLDEAPSTLRCRYIASAIDSHAPHSCCIPQPKLRSVAFVHMCRTHDMRAHYPSVRGKCKRSVHYPQPDRCSPAIKVEISLPTQSCCAIAGSSYRKTRRWLTIA